MRHRVRLVTAAVSVTSLMILIGLPTAATAKTVGGVRATGKQLVNRFFSDIRDHKVADLRRFLSPALQILRADGSRQTKSQYLAKLPDVRSYKLRNLLSTSSPKAIVVTYQVAANEIINGKPFGTGYEPRITVFVNNSGTWQLIAHGNFNRPK